MPNASILTNHSFPGPVLQQVDRDWQDAGGTPGVSMSRGILSPALYFFLSVELPKFVQLQFLPADTTPRNVATVNRSLILQVCHASPRYRRPQLPKLAGPSALAMEIQKDGVKWRKGVKRILLMRILLLRISLIEIVC